MKVSTIVIGFLGLATSALAGNDAKDFQDFWNDFGDTSFGALDSSSYCMKPPGYTICPKCPSKTTSYPRIMNYNGRYMTARYMDRTLNKASNTDVTAGRASNVYGWGWHISKGRVNNTIQLDDFMDHCLQHGRLWANGTRVQIFDNHKHYTDWIVHKVDTTGQLDNKGAPITATYWRFQQSRSKLCITSSSKYIYMSKCGKNRRDQWFDMIKTYTADCCIMGTSTKRL